MHSVMGRNILFGCQGYGIEVLDYFCMGQLSFHGGLFQKLYTNMNYSNNDVDFYVISLLNECILLRYQQLSGLHFSELENIISYLCCS